MAGIIAMIMAAILHPPIPASAGSPSQPAQLLLAAQASCNRLIGVEVVRPRAIGPYGGIYLDSA